MGMRTKLDEDLSLLVGEPLRAAGYEVAAVVEQGWGGLSDSELWPRVVAERVFFVTADKGFGDIRAYLPGTHSGILLLRPDRESVLDYRDLVAEVVRIHPLNALVGALVVATPRGIRVRRATRSGDSGQSK